MANNAAALCQLLAQYGLAAGKLLCLTTWNSRGVGTLELMRALSVLSESVPEVAHVMTACTGPMFGMGELQCGADPAAERPTISYRCKSSKPHSAVPPHQ